MDLAASSSRTAGSTRPRPLPRPLEPDRLLDRIRGLVSRLGEVESAGVDDPSAGIPRAEIDDLQRRLAEVIKRDPTGAGR